MPSSILIAFILLRKIEAESLDESKNERCVEGEKGKVEHGHLTEKLDRLGI